MLRIKAVCCFIIFHFFSFSLLGESFPSPLKVGMELSYPPFEMIDPQGHPAGISVEMAKALGNYLNVPIDFQNLPFVGLIPSLKDGKIDLIISSLSISDQRRHSIDFSEPYASIGLCLLVKKSSPIQSIEDVNQPNIKVVVKSGTSGQLYAFQHLTKATVIVLDKEASCVLEVVQGKVDAFIYDQLSIYTHWQKNLNTTRAILTPFKKEQWAIGIKKGNDALRLKVNAFITHFQKEDGFKKLGERYLPEQFEAFKKMGIPFLF
jgi:polar amino acid transport system substrate-binding protein